MRSSRALQLAPRLASRPSVLPTSTTAATSPHRIASPRAASLAQPPPCLRHHRPRLFSTSPIVREDRTLRPHQRGEKGEHWHPLTEPPANAEENHWDHAQGVKEDEPHYSMTFTCKPCRHRSAHRVSKHGYHKGTVLIQCPNCKVRHLISDHLEIFAGGKAVTLDDILKEKGELIKRGVLNDEGNLELWDDGTTTPHKKADSTTDGPQQLGSGGDKSS